LLSARMALAGVSLVERLAVLKRLLRCHLSPLEGRGRIARRSG